MDERILLMKARGYCCSQTIMAMGLEHLEKDNPDLIHAMGGLCNGVHHEGTCGALSGAVCLISLVFPGDSGQRQIEEFIHWFRDSFGSTLCHEILDGDESKKAILCPNIVDACYKMSEELLEW